MAELKPPSLEDVAAAAGVSTATVSRALRGSPSVRPATIARVEEAARALQFSVSRSASSLATGKTRRIAVLMAERFQDWFCGQSLDAIVPTLSASGFDLTVYRVRTRAERARFFSELPARKNADALIVLSFALMADEQEKLHALGLPIVYLNQHVPGETSVGVDDILGARLAVGHLLALGHRDIGFVGERFARGETFDYSSQDRYRGYAATLEEAGVDVAAQVVIREEAGPALGDRLAAALLSARSMPTAVFVEDDGQAMALMRSLARMNVRVPEDLSVVGFDGQDAGDELGLTTISQPIGESGRRAAELAIDLAGGPAGPAVAELLEPSLLLRRSTRRHIASEERFPR